MISADQSMNVAPRPSEGHVDSFVSSLARAGEFSICIANIRPATVGEWDSIWQECPYSTYFHSREWAEIWSVYTKGSTSPTPLLVTFSDGNKALLPLSLQKSYRGVVSTYLSSPAGTFGGWISADELKLDHAILLANYLSELPGGFYWRLNPYDPLVFQAGVKTTYEDETHVLNLADGIDASYQCWRRGHSYGVRKARKEGVIVKLASSLEDWHAYYEAYMDSLRRWGDTASSTYTLELFDEIFRHNSKHIKLWLAVYREKVIAGALCFYAPRHVAYWHGAVIESYFHLRPNHLLVYEAAKHACEEGLSCFDFNPSGGHEGVKNFKRGFRAIGLPSPVVRRQGKMLRVMTIISKVAKGLGR
jgi:hypothetical protein